MSESKHRILLIGQKSESIAELINKNISKALIDRHNSDDSLDILINDPFF